MDLLLQVSEEELEEFPEPPVDHTDQDKPDRTSTGGTQSSNISHQLQDSDSDQYRPQKHLRSQQLQSVSSPGTEGLQHDRQHDQAPCTHLYVGRSNMTRH